MGGTFTQQTAINPNYTYSLLSGQEKRIKVEFKNSDDVYYDPYSIVLTIYRPDTVEFLSETYSLVSPNIKRESEGNYYIDFSGSTSYIGDYQFVWAWRDSSGGELFNGFQMVSLLPVQVVSTLPYLRNQIDKSQKDLNNIFGYNDEQLYMYIKGGLYEINRVPPNTDFTLINYPWSKHQQLIVDVSTFVALQGQGLVSIDTDASYSLQGNSMSIDHWSKISSFLSMLQTRINGSIMHFKLNYMTRIGGVKVERGPGFRQVSMFQAAPSGVSFGNIMGVR